MGIDVGHRASAGQDRTGLPDVPVPYCMYYLRTHSAGIFEPQLSGESIGRPAIASSIIIITGGAARTSSVANISRRRW